jgi:hypothetical protein
MANTTSASDPYARVKDPFLDEGMRGWIHKTAFTESWRAMELTEFEDLLADGYMIFFKCKRRYAADIAHPTQDERKWFQTLVKSAFSNHIHSLAAKHKGVSVRPVSERRPAEEATSDFVERYLPSQPEQASFLTLLANAPVELAQLIQVLATDAADLFHYERGPRLGRHRGVRETKNEFYCRILNLNPAEHDIVGQLKAYFG